MRWLILFACLGYAELSFAQQIMEIIPLRHRTVEQVLPSLQVFVEPGGALSGMDDQLIVRSSRQNIEQIKQALSALDLPARRLMIYVSQNRDAENRQHGAELSGRVDAGQNVRIIQPPDGARGSTQIEVRRGDANSRLNAQFRDSRYSNDMQSNQSVQVLNGGRGYIRVGQSLPLALRQVVRGPNGTVITESVVYRDIGQGFYAVPTLVGDRVTLEISPQFDTAGDQGSSSVSSQRVSTRVSGRLGEWIELGGSSQLTAMVERGNLGTRANELSENRSLWLRVEELP
ncbi:MAG: hypothetical protein IPL29_03240 [Propionivibrio sp.]|uniref:hypothetical protein n=1 Tax=Propionivibrio sp. TaxID=2212460 RepID=UPI0025D1A543|nr:hypothetical protein [Propionivibrio sp.]MBK7356427.1 hypothetical protein [Propionivibrio sp.]MBK8400106.1 hypothetical protein [Propionivibrio sp.]MBL0207924.1 hypothetical protein [Propionivibrio sp.]